MDYGRLTSAEQFHDPRTLLVVAPDLPRVVSVEVV
jgi:hypothetical protein